MTVVTSYFTIFSFIKFAGIKKKSKNARRLTRVTATASGRFTRWTRTVLNLIPAILSLLAMKRSYRAISGGYKRRAVPTRRRKVVRRGGLIPSYRGFQPRAFSRGEWKYLDVAINNDINSTMVATLLNGLVPGSGASQRIGMKVAIRSVELRITWETTPATGVEQQGRHLIVLDRQANGVGPAAVTDFLLAASPMAPRALINRKRFKILYDRSLPMGATAVASGNPQGRCFKAYLKFRRPIVVEYNVGNAGTVADIVSNAMFFCTIGTEGAGNTDINCTGYIRVRYTDN